MNCCNKDCNQGRLCPERAERIREAKRQLETFDGTLPRYWFGIGIGVCAAIIVISVGGLILEALQ